MTARRLASRLAAAAPVAARRVASRLAAAAPVAARRVASRPAAAAPVAARRFPALLACSIALLAASAPAALAQEPGTEVGGSVPSYLELGIQAPASLAAFPATTGIAQTTIGATITSTEAPVELSVADGDTDASLRRGRLAAPSGRVLAEPLQATVGSAAFQPLDQPFGPLLMRWSDVLSGQRSVIRLRQRVTAAALRAGPYAKTVLVTASTQTP